MWRSQGDNRFFFGGERRVIGFFLQQNCLNHYWPLEDMRLPSEELRSGKKLESFSLDLGD